MQDKETGDITHLDVLGKLISSEDRWPVTGDGGTRCENILYVQARHVCYTHRESKLTIMIQLTSDRLNNIENYMFLKIFYFSKIFTWQRKMNLLGLNHLP